MTTVKHTPGPWHVGEDAKVYGPWQTGESQAMRRMVADCSRLLRSSAAIDALNAKLIAAAPDLADALAEVMWCADFEGGEHTEEEWNDYDRRRALAFEAARSALKKAGRTP